jgi:signal transduction histidine kinase
VTGGWDPDRLTQVVSNLVGNAIEHGAKTPVTLVASGAGDRGRLTVDNDGDPIPPHSTAVNARVASQMSLAANGRSIAKVQPLPGVLLT